HPQMESDLPIGLRLQAEGSGYDFFQYLSGSTLLGHVVWLDAFWTLSKLQCDDTCQSVYLAGSQVNKKSKFWGRLFLITAFFFCSFPMNDPCSGVSMKTDYYTTQQQQFIGVGRNFSKFIP